MNQSELISQSINENIKVWENDHAKLVVAIDGYAGSGKTSIANFIGTQNSDALIVHLDDFIKPVNERIELMNKAKDKSKVFEFEWYRYEALEKLIVNFKTGMKKEYSEKIYSFETNTLNPHTFDLSKRTLIIEGVFLFRPSHAISKMFDKKIYLNTNQTEADTRRIEREMKKWGKDYLPETHPDNWTRYFKEAYLRYSQINKPEALADVVY